VDSKAYGLWGFSEPKNPILTNPDSGCSSSHLIRHRSTFSLLITPSISVALAPSVTTSAGARHAEMAAVIADAELLGPSANGDAFGKARV
jgi:hypothetical protein